MLLGLALASIALGSQVPTEPILTIETGAHQFGPEAAIDNARTTLVTGGGNPDVRVWDLPSGRLRRVLRPPVASNGDGTLFRIAVSGDGNTVAASTQQQAGWDGGFAVYIFDLKSGRIRSKLDHLPACASGIALSRDGDRLAAGFTSGEVGIFDLTLKMPKRIMAGKIASDSVYGATFDESGSCAFVHSDGFFVIYDRSGRPTRKVASPLIRGSRTVRYSPNGRHLAISGEQVAIYDTVTRRIYELDQTHNGVGAFAIVSWSPDGSKLFGGCTAREVLIKNAPSDLGRRRLRVWSTPGWRPRDYFTDRINIDGVAAGQTGCYVTYSDGTIARVDPMGTVRQLVTASHLRYHQPLGRLGSSLMRANADLTEIAIPLDQLAPKWLTIDVNRRRVSIGNAEPPETWGQPHAALSGFPFNPMDWTIQGKPVKSPGGPVTSAAIAPDRGAMYFAGIWGISKYTPDGVRERFWFTPKWASQVMVSADSKVLVTCHFDGSIRWWKASDGSPLLALYVQNPTLDWILWTPTGYYDASVGGERSLAWRINGGPRDVASIHPCGHFRGRFFRPDVVDRVLETRNEAAAVIDANEAAGLDQERHRLRGPAVDETPPTVRIERLDVRSDEGALALDFELSYRSEAEIPPDRLSLIGDGRLIVTLDRPANSRDWQSWKGTAPLSGPLGHVVVTTEANGNSYAVDASVTSRGAGTARPPTGRGYASPSKIFVIAIGLNQVQGLPELAYAEDDASTFVETIRKHKPRQATLVEPVLLTGLNATHQALEAAINRLRQQQLSENDLTILYVAGHGLLMNNTYVFPLRNFAPDAINGTSLRSTDIADVSEAAGMSLKLLFFDTCSAGAAANAKLMTWSAGDACYGVFGACGKDQQARESSLLKHGNFTSVVVQGLSGAADPVREWINVVALTKYVSDVFYERFRDLPEPSHDAHGFPDRFAITEPVRK